MVTSNSVVELIQNITFENQPYVGKSICVLAKFSQEKLPIPNGFVISSLGFNQFVDFSDLGKYFENSKDRNGFEEGLHSSFEAAEIPGILRKEIDSHYSKISGFTDAHVNIKAFILDQDGNELIHNDFAEYDVRGEEDLVKTIKDLYGRIVLSEPAKAHLYFSGELQIVLFVQKAIQSEASGVMFTSNIVTKDDSKLVIEAVYGLESGAERESIVPDQYVFDKNSNNISEKHISTQEFMILRQMGVGPTTQRVNISPAWQKRQKIDDKHILVLAKTGLLIEDELNEPQEVFWSFESGKIWINFIESSNKLDPKDVKSKSLQSEVDAMLKNESESDAELNFHIPQDLVKERELLVDLVLKEPEISKKHKKKKKINRKEPEKMNQDTKKQITKEPLLEGTYYSGESSQGEVCFDPETARVNNILVLKGDEDIPSTLKVAGMVIEDESDILAERLFEYFKVPVITGVPLARKILKAGESVSIDGSTGHIFELVPYSQPAEEIEMTFVNNQNGQKEVTNFTLPVDESSNEVEVKAEIKPVEVPDLEDLKDVPVGELLEDNGKTIKVSSDSLVATEETVNKAIDSGATVEIKKISNDKVEIKKKTFVPDYSQQSKPKSTPPANFNVLKPSGESNTKDLSKLLDLVESEDDVLSVQSKKRAESENVEGVSANDQMKVWGKSLERMISESKKVPSPVAAKALEQVVEGVSDIEDESKEFAFDEEERYIAEVKEESSNSQIKGEEYVPTATKVFVGLIDEKLDPGLQNFDGVVFTSTYDVDVFIEVLEDVLETSAEKPVMVICPPYESAALSKFFKRIYSLRNKGYRNLSVILPDYRNKKDLSEYKKSLTTEGLRRSSTFEIFANLSKTINVFRIAELEEAMVDGVYVDLFRLKMNMLGVEKLSASTKYVEGMQNLVEYVHENLSIEGKALVNITAFDNQKMILEHLGNFKFWGVVCEQSKADKVKKTLSSIEQKQISSPKSKRR